jgi:hypothetical protein
MYPQKLAKEMYFFVSDIHIHAQGMAVEPEASPLPARKLLDDLCISVQLVFRYT